MDAKKSNTTYGKCRCCLAKGNHRDIMKEYYFNGIREVFFDIFMECFNLFLSTNALLPTLICTTCVHRLRDATSFRMMVASTERQLLQAIAADDKDTVFVNVHVEGNTLEGRIDVKIEREADIKDEPTDAVIDVVDYDSDYVADVVCRICSVCIGDGFLEKIYAFRYVLNLVSRSYSMPKSANFVSEEPTENFVDREAALLGRFARVKLPPLPTRGMLPEICPEYCRQLDMLEHVKVLPKSIMKLLEDDDRRRVSSGPRYVSDKIAHIINAGTILEHSNVTPFKSKSRIGFPCFYCRNMCEDLEQLRQHTYEHKKTEIKSILKTYTAECLVVYVDITDLKCTLCEKNIRNLNELKTHLINVHKKTMYPGFSDRVIPFKLNPTRVYECQVCGFNFETFGSIERHMNVHFRNYVCKVCGTGFVTKYRLKVHTKSMHAGGTFPCEACGKIFSTQQKHKNHFNTVHKSVKRFKCTKCPERFSEYFRRQKHLVQVHGVAPLQYKCNVCEKTFDRRYTLSRHMKRDHLEERDYQCEMCSYKCFTKNELRVHMVKHNGERIFECSVCKKSYARKKTLKEHMRIHNNDRRFACAICGQAFVQKCSLKGHLKTHHLEFSLQ